MKKLAALALLLLAFPAHADGLKNLTGTTIGGGHSPPSPTCSSYSLDFSNTCNSFHLGVPLP